MATDFFERQAAARRATRWLIVVFFVAMFAMVGIVTIATAVLLDTMQPSPQSHYAATGAAHDAIDRLSIPLGLGAFTALLICGGSLFKIALLRGGGTAVAEGLGAHRIPQNTTDPVERRLVNVVEEMALASGVPVPPIYLLHEEPGINAFAAGYSPSDAVVAVTRGTAEQLTREELQGVVAHEFSHILHGDMRLNIRLIGILYGILLLGLVGRMLFHITARSGAGRRNSKDGNAMLFLLFLGLALIVIGSLGTVIGGIIKAAVSRQREFLADSSAVQFTRNATGIAGALKRIGGSVLGSRMNHPQAAELSHMYFGQGVWEGLTGLMATHPPLAERIRRLDPHWDGKFPPQLPASIADTGRETTASFAGAIPPERDHVPVAVVRQSADHVGSPDEIHREYSAKLIASLSPPLLENVHEPYGARGVMFALLLDKDPSTRDKQWNALSAGISTDVVELTRSLAPLVDAMDTRARLPLIDLALPALRTMTTKQYVEFVQVFQKLVQADDRITLFEWTLHCVLLRHLRPQFHRDKPPRTQYFNLKRLGNECGVLLSALAYSDHAGPIVAQAHREGANLLPDVAIPLVDAKACGLRDVQRALATLSTVAPEHRRRLVEACAVVICHDRDVTVRESELFRGICDMLDCPMPPLLPGQPLTWRAFAESGAQEAGKRNS